MEKQTFGQKLLEKYFLPVYLTGVVVFCGGVLGQMIYDRVTADKTTAQVEKRFSPSTFYGFDDNKDGTIDRVVEYGGIAGARMAAPTRRTFTSKDKEFSDLTKVFDQ